MRFGFDLRQVKVAHARPPGGAVAQYARAAFHPVSHFDPQLGVCRQQNIHPRAEFDQPHALATLECLAFSATADDAPRQQSRNLLERNFQPRIRALAAQRDDALLIAFGRSRVHGVEILAFLIVDAAHCAADGRAVDVHIENAQKNADALARAFRSGDGCSFGDQAVARRNNQTIAGGNRAMRIAEKPEEKCRQQDGSDTPGPGACKPHNRRGHG